MQDMESGIHPEPNGDSPPPRLFKGCVVSPFKATEAEQVWQYAKLLHKVRAGADFIISQLGFDLSKFRELMTFLQQHRIKLPVLANIFIPSLPVARAMAAGKVPGVLLSDDLVRRMEAEAAAGRLEQTRLDRAAFMLAWAKRCGYQGVHLGGNKLRFRDIQAVLDKFEALNRLPELPERENDYPLPTTWYFYHPDKQETALQPGQRQGLVSVARFSHALFFEQRNWSSRLFARFCLYCAQGKGRTAALTLLERAIKRLLFTCRMCGDCTLSRSAYLCPQSGCPKRLLNGPCGGSRFGFCEVHPERRCFWVRVYERLDPQTTLADLAALPHLPPKDWALEKTSSWINYFRSKPSAV
jgi:methylenetetrahydrofolate reductase (NADPH)